MKKALFLLIILSVAFTAAYGQKKKKPVDNGSKPIAGNMGLSFRVSGLNLTSFNNFNDNAFTKGGEFLFRYYLTDKIVARAAVGIQSQNTQYYVKSDSTYAFQSFSKPEQAGVDVLQESIGDTSIQSFGMSFSPGVEYHLGTSAKLDPYVGAQIGFGFVGKTTTKYSGSVTETYKGGNGITGRNIGETTYAITSVTPGGMQFGLNLLGGFNYFFSDHIAIGAEYSLGFMSSRIGGESTTKGSMTMKGIPGDDVTAAQVVMLDTKIDQKETIRSSSSGMQTKATGGVVLSIFF